MLKLINGLERQLAAIKIEDTPTVPTATPAGHITEDNIKTPDTSVGE